MRVLPVGETGTTVHHSGTPGWEIALIVVAAVAVVGLTLALSLRTSAKSKQRQSSKSSRPVQGTLVSSAN